MFTSLLLDRNVPTSELMPLPSTIDLEIPVPAPRSKNNNACCCRSGKYVLRIRCLYCVNVQTSGNDVTRDQITRCGILSSQPHFRRPPLTTGIGAHKLNPPHDHQIFLLQFSTINASTCTLMPRHLSSTVLDSLKPLRHARKFFVAKLLDHVSPTLVSQLFGGHIAPLWVFQA